MSRLAVGGRNRCFCSSEPNWAMTGPDHLGVERQRFGHARQLHLVEPDLSLQGRPVLAAPFHRPVRYGQAVVVEDSLGGDHVVGHIRTTGSDALADLGGYLVGEEVPHFFTELGVPGVQSEGQGLPRSVLVRGLLRGCPQRVSGNTYRPAFAVRSKGRCEYVGGAVGAVQLDIESGFCCRPARATATSGSR